MSWYYTKQGYALIAAEDSEQGHWIGGAPAHSGAECPVCRVPLLLLADLNCVWIRQYEEAKLFQQLDRLPLYFCWKCSADDLSYQVVSSTRVRIFGNLGKPQGEDFPYANFPDQFKRCPAKLVPIPYELAKLLAVAQEVGPEWLSGDDTAAVSAGIAGLRHDGFSQTDVNRHQVGGLLPLIQGHESPECPNPKCKNHKLAHEGYGVRMLELAVIHDDPRSGLPMVERAEPGGEGPCPTQFNEWVQVVYWVCEECLTLAASNRCD